MNRLAQQIFNELNTSEVHIHMDEMPSLWIDQARMGQVFSNLFLNAIEHGEASEIELKWNEKAGKGQLIISNNGKSIASKHLEKLFDKGFTTKKGGTGLGLAIVRRIVQAHGWTIHVENQPSTSFIITIPNLKVQNKI